MIGSDLSWHPHDMVRLGQRAAAPLLLLALAGLACGGTDTTPGADGTDSDAEGSLPCTTDADCPPNYFCSGTECYYNSKPGFGCLQHSDCGEGQFCEFNECVSAAPIPACTNWTWRELDIRAEVGANTRALHLADLDGDGDDELVALGELEVEVVEDGLVRVVLGPFEPDAIAELALLDLDGDGTLDLLLRPDDPEQPSSYALGVGDGSFAAAQSGPVLDLRAMQVIDWEPGGATELAGVRASDRREATVTSMLLDPRPLIERVDFGIPGAWLDGVTAADLDGDGRDEIILARNCGYDVRAKAGWRASGYSFSVDQGACPLAGGDHDADGHDELAILHRAIGASKIHMVQGAAVAAGDDTVKFLDAIFDVPQGHVGLRFAKPASTGPNALLLFGAGAPMLVHVGQTGPCYESLLEPTTSLLAAVGDVDGDGDDELAFGDEHGRVRVFDAE